MYVRGGGLGTYVRVVERERVRMGVLMCVGVGELVHMLGVGEWEHMVGWRSLMAQSNEHQSQKSDGRHNKGAG